MFGAGLSSNIGLFPQTTVSTTALPVYRPDIQLTRVSAQCSAATNHLITNAVFNISSDIMIIVIPMPIFLRSTLSLQRKVVLCLVFAVGTFTVSFTSPHLTSLI